MSSRKAAISIKTQITVTISQIKMIQSKITRKTGKTIMKLEIRTKIIRTKYQVIANRQFIFPKKMQINQTVRKTPNSESVDPS